MRPAQHYTMGGVRTDHTGESPTLKGLFAAGEAACWDMHGFNRLGGNSVAETVVAGMIVGEYIADFCDRPESDVQLSTGLIHEFLQHEQAKLDALVGWQGQRGRQRAARADAGDHDERRSASSAPVRTSPPAVERAAGAAAAEPEHRTALHRARRESRARVRVPSAEDAEAGALRRLRRADAHREPRARISATTTRGATTPNGCKRTLATWKNASDTLPTLACEPIDVMQMELPPGWRGYGAKDYVDHPDTARRAAEVEAHQDKACRQRPRWPCRRR